MEAAAPAAECENHKKNMSNNPKPDQLLITVPRENVGTLLPLLRLDISSLRRAP